MNIPREVIDQAAELINRCSAAGYMVATAESCTGGLIGAALTAVSGSSAVYDRGFVTYSNQAKQDMLGVPAGMIAAEGAVSKEVACAMAQGALERSQATLSVAVTGIAGPGGGTLEKPVGLVHLAAAHRDGKLLHRREVFPGDRDAVREQTLRVALAMMTELAE
ncbi:CinA family protein [Telmatospirillum sp. J64-1]|uniref:CinA family protein n=1 Tax=Telmatospirillum sp. J64-1 TaxID=2502183 RepID=UPI00115EC624|nr:CinA family protein [Telmatospirillum sp. J64-1]